MSVFSHSLEPEACDNGQCPPFYLNIGFHPHEVKRYFDLTDDQIDLLIEMTNYTYGCYTGRKVPTISHELVYKLDAVRGTRLKERYDARIAAFAERCEADRKAWLEKQKG